MSDVYTAMNGCLEAVLLALLLSVFVALSVPVFVLGFFALCSSFVRATRAWTRVSGTTTVKKTLLARQMQQGLSESFCILMCI